MRTADYARFSTDSQRDASVEDQQRECAGLAVRYGLPAPRHFADYAISGERRDRPGYLQMLAAARAREFDVLLLYNLKRLSRAEDLPQVLAQFKFWRIRVITCDGYDSTQEGSELRGWVDAMMGNQYNREAAKQAHRGLMGLALKGCSAGGLAYGYQPIKRADGGKWRTVDPEQATVVVRIFERFVAGRCARDIAVELNAASIPSPSGGTWRSSAIYGDLKRGIGILANPIYAGRVIWNRSQFVKDPATGHRIRQERPRSEWVETSDEALRIVPEALWEAAQHRLVTTRARTKEVQDRVGRQGRQGGKPKYLLTGIVRCGACGGPMSMLNQTQYGCTTRRDRGTCGNALTVSRGLLEQCLLAGIKRELLSEEAWREFSRQVREVQRQSCRRDSTLRQRLRAVERERDNIMAAIRQGIVGPTTKAALAAAESAVEAAQAELASEAQPLSMIPRLRDTWRALAEKLENLQDVDGGREALRQIVGDRVPLIPENGGYVAEIGGEASVRVVAGAGSVTSLRAFRIPITKGAHSK